MIEHKTTRMGRISIMGLPCNLYKNNENGRWILATRLCDRELFSKYTHQLFDDDLLEFWQTDKQVLVETRFANLKKFWAKLRKPKPIES